MFTAGEKVPDSEIPDDVFLVLDACDMREQKSTLTRSDEAENQRVIYRSISSTLPILGAQSCLTTKSASVARGVPPPPPPYNARIKKSSAYMTKGSSIKGRGKGLPWSGDVRKLGVF